MSYSHLLCGLPMLLIHPPVAKPSEPPAGIAQLAGSLLAHNHPCTVVDFNIEALLDLIACEPKNTDAWTRRAYRNRAANLGEIRSQNLYASFARYQKCVLELNRLAEISGGRNITVSLANYQDSSLSPLKSEDLLSVARFPERCLFTPFYRKRLPQLLADSSGFLGISINYLSQALSSFALIGVIRQLAPETKIVVGGGLITSWMRSPYWRDPFGGLIDYCIDGCGVMPLLSLLGDTEVRQAPLRLDLLPLDSYLAPGRIVPYSTSSGCFWNRCSFCPERAEKTPYRRKNTARVMQELGMLRRDTAPALIHFLDNAVSPSLLQDFSEEMPAAPWYGFVRVTRHLQSRDFCRQLKRSGCLMLKLGIESGDQGVLDRLEKGIDLALVARALENLEHAGIAAYVYLLFGTPAESRKEAEKTLEFTVAHHHHIAFLNLAIFNMPINSHERPDLQTSDFYSGDLSLYTDFSHPRGWNRRQVRSFLDREFKKKPEIAAILKREPPIFTSNHAPFFCKGPGSPE